MEKLPDSINNTLKNILDAPSKNIGNVLSDLMYLKFGHITQKANKRRILDKYGLQTFEDRLKQYLSEVPVQNLIEPDYQTMMLALDNAENCMNSDVLRDLFAKLLIRACNSDYRNLIHPSFPSVLSQMSPYDAKIFKFFVDQKPEIILTYQQYNDDCFYNCIPYFFDSYQNYDEVISESLSISSLMRLGLIAFHDDAIVFEVKNTSFEKSAMYTDFENRRISSNKYAESRLEGKACILTPYGEAFSTACF